MKASVAPLSPLQNLEFKHSLGGNMCAVHLHTERNFNYGGKESIGYKYFIAVTVGS